MHSFAWQTVQQLVLELDPMDELETQHRSSILGWLQSTQDIFRLMSIDETVGNVGAHVDVSIWYAFRGDAASAITLCTNEFEDTAWKPFDDVPTLATNINLPRFIQKLERESAAIAGEYR